MEKHNKNKIPIDFIEMPDIQKRWIKIDEF